jgi:serine/threonine protein kinase
MWTLGVVLYVLLAGGYPFHETNPAALLQRIQGGHASVVFPDYLSGDARALVCSLLQRDPLLRPTAQALLVHTWLQPESPCSIRRRKPAAPATLLGDLSYPLETRDQLLDAWEQIVPLSCGPTAAAATAAAADAGSKPEALRSPFSMPEANFFTEADNDGSSSTAASTTAAAAAAAAAATDLPRPKRMFLGLSVEQLIN